MEKHRKVYLESFGFHQGDKVYCEVCNCLFSHVHHIVFKGMGGSKLWDFIENLIGLCIFCHDRAHGICAPGYTRLTVGQLVLAHKRKMIDFEVEYKKEKFEIILNEAV